MQEGVGFGQRRARSETTEGRARVVRDAKSPVPGRRVQRTHMDMDQQGEGIQREERVSVAVQGTHVCSREDL